ncbi:hypothetical protein GGI11_002169 [Coemansia sp. RSA 2049]|nr:hypothetical protein GGI11_002169 [Coemansia sp. RSA 2049]KAJ2523023.1 hypothetical protein H4217_000366 [Coemansia sp. RSA 1939]KAJ2616835.1 hypothetical protein EV177_000862 [Coemansia sp. RSA 1804]
MDVSHTATIGRSQRGLDTMRDLKAMLAQASNEDTTVRKTDSKSSKRMEPTADDTSSSTGSLSDADDIDSETAMNTIYNLLNELGDLNRSNRRTAEVLSEKFSTLQTRVTRAEDEASGRGADELAFPSSAAIDVAVAEPAVTATKENGGDVDGSVVAMSSSISSDTAFHTPPNNTGQSTPLPLDVVPSKEDAQTQTTLGALDLDIAATAREEKLETENQELRTDVQKLIGALKDQQLMSKEYESTLAMALGALRSAAFERHLEISGVQDRYRELLESEKSLNHRLKSENVDLKHALGNAASAIRLSLSSESEAMVFESAGDESTSSDGSRINSSL